MPMSCQDVRDRFAPWLDQELSPGDEELCAQHLHGCEACATELSRLDGQRFFPPELPDLEGPDFWGPMDRALDGAWGGLQPDRAAPTPPWWRKERRLSGTQALALAVAMLLAIGLAAAQSWQLAEVNARADALQARLDREARLSAVPGPALPLEPHAVAAHTPFRGSL